MIHYLTSSSSTNNTAFIFDKNNSKLILAIKGERRLENEYSEEYLAFFGIAVYDLSNGKVKLEKCQLIDHTFIDPDDYSKPYYSAKCIRTLYIGKYYYYISNYGITRFDTSDNYKETRLDF